MNIKMKLRKMLRKVASGDPYVDIIGNQNDKETSMYVFHDPSGKSIFLQLKDDKMLMIFSIRGKMYDVTKYQKEIISAIYHNRAKNFWEQSALE